MKTYPLSYPADFLLPGVVTCLNRDDYRAQTSKEAPAYDPSRPPQYWYSPDALPNLPGAAAYPVYAVPESDLLLDGAPVNKFYLSTQAQWLAMYQKLRAKFPGLGIGLSIEMNDTRSGHPYTVGPSGREICNILINGAANHVGELLRAEAVNGVGAPGDYEMDGPGAIKWVPAPVINTPDTPPLPPPVRDLLPTEYMNLMGDQVLLKPVLNVVGAGIDPIDAHVVSEIDDIKTMVGAILAGLKSRGLV